MLAEALAASDSERKELLSELTTATSQVSAGIPIRGVNVAIRKLAIMRANYLAAESEYNAKLRKIFDTLAKPASAQNDPPARVRK